MSSDILQSNDCFYSGEDVVTKTFPGTLAVHVVILCDISTNVFYYY